LPVEKAESNENDDDKTFQELTKHLNIKKEKDEENFDTYNEKETQEDGKVSWNVYTNFLKSVKNVPLVIFVLFLRVLNQSITSFIDYFVAQWVNWEESIGHNSHVTAHLSNTTDLKIHQENISRERQQYIDIYIGLICALIFAIFCAEFSFFYSLLRLVLK
jgi:hypothetical protein